MAADCSLLKITEDKRRAEPEGERAQQQQSADADSLIREAVNPAARRAPQRDASTDEPEEPFRLSRIVDAVCKRPELTGQ